MRKIVLILFAFLPVELLLINYTGSPDGASQTEKRNDKIQSDEIPGNTIQYTPKADRQAEQKAIHAHSTGKIACK